MNASTEGYFKWQDTLYTLHHITDINNTLIMDEQSLLTPVYVLCLYMIYTKPAKMVILVLDAISLQLYLRVNGK